MALDTADKFAIQELIHRYCHIADYGPPEAMRELFTADGVFEAPARGFNFRGVDALIEFFHSRRDAPSVGRHIISNTVIEGGGNEAQAISYLVVVSAEGSPRSIPLFGRYKDRLLRTANGWRFTHRLVDME